MGWSPVCTCLHGISVHGFSFIIEHKDVDLHVVFKCPPGYKTPAKTGYFHESK